MKNNKKNIEIDYYGDKDNYIHLKFEDCRKCYFFTNDFIGKYPAYASEFAKYFQGEKSKFKSVFGVVAYTYKNKIPVHFYYNFTDLPAKSEKEIMEYLVKENSYVGEL